MQHQIQYNPRVFLPNRYGKVIILSDSMLSYTDPKRGPYITRDQPPQQYPKFNTDYATVKAYPGCSISKFAEEIIFQNFNLGEGILPEGSTWDEFSLCVIHAGTNDYANGDQDRIIQWLDWSIRMIREQNPDIGFIVNGILPRPKDFDDSNPTIKIINSQIKNYCREKRGCFFNPCHKSFLEHYDSGDKTVTQRIRTDQELYDPTDYHKLHLSARGHARMIKLISDKVALFRQAKIIH